MRWSLVIICLGFWGATANAENQVFGDFRLSMGNYESKNAAGVKSDFVQANNNASRLGFKGSFEENGITAFYHYQLGAVNDTNAIGSGTTSRFYFAGLRKEGFGEVSYGRMSTPYKMAGVRLDPFYDTAAGQANAGANFGQSSLSNGFTDNSLMYWSPRLKGVSVLLGTVLADTAAKSADYNFGLSFKNYGFDAGIQHITSNSSSGVANSVDGDKSTRFHVKYSAEKWSLRTSFEMTDAKSGNDANFAYLAGTFHLCEKSYLAGSFGSVSDTGATSTDGTGFALGYFHKVLENMQAHVLFSSNTFDDDSSTTTYVVGVSHKFSWKIN